MIILDDKKIEEFGFYVEPGHDDPITPNLEHKTIPIPGRPGLWNFGTEIKEKQFNFPLKIHDRFHDNMQSAYNKLVAFLFGEYGHPKQLKLVREYEPDKFYMVKVVSQMLPERLTEEGTLFLPLVADDPYKYSNVTADEIMWGSEIITFEYDYTLGYDNPVSFMISGSKTVYITVEGLAVQPIFEITGTANNLRIWNDNHEIKLGSFTNTSWIIDCEKYSVLKNGQETMVDMWDFYLLPGRQPLRFSGTNINITVNVKYRDKYM